MGSKVDARARNAKSSQVHCDNDNRRPRRDRKIEESRVAVKAWFCHLIDSDGWAEIGPVASAMAKVDRARRILDLLAAGFPEDV